MILRFVHEPPIFVNKFSATMLLLKKACNLIAYTYLIYIYKELRKKNKYNTQLPLLLLL